MCLLTLLSYLIFLSLKFSMCKMGIVVSAILDMTFLFQVTETQFRLT